jgi:adenylate cyclase
MERRLAAILAADVVGYSRLIREDEAGTLAAIKVHREQLIQPKVIERKGRIVKLMGDGLLIEFPSAVEAVQCAVEIQHLIGDRNADVSEENRVTYRIGINIGDIVVEDNDIYGDGVNVAARLEGLAEPGGICVARNVFDQVKDKLDLTIEHLGEREVKNIAEPVTVYRVVLDEKAAALVTPVVRKPAMPTFHRRVAAAAMAVVLVAAAGGALWWQPWAPDVEPASVERMAFPLPDRPSIAVLPFANLGSDSSYEMISDGITNDIITSLSKYRDFVVIAGHSTSTYKDKPVTVQQVAEELGVRYVLEGSMQTFGDRVRFHIKFVDAIVGEYLWTERFDRDMTDIFALQDEIAQFVVTAIATVDGRLADTDLARAKLKESVNLDAFELVQLAREKRHQFDEEGIAKSKQLLKQALNIDPDFARAHADMAWTYMQEVWNGYAQSPDLSVASAVSHAKKAVEIDYSFAEGYWSLGAAYQTSGMNEEALVSMERALQLNPNNADILAEWGGFWLPCMLDKREEGIAAIERAMRLNPFYPNWYGHLWVSALFFSYRYDDVTDASRIIEAPTFIVRQMVAAAYGHTGNIEAAAEAVAKLLELQPDFTVQAVSHADFGMDACVEEVREGLRRAGVREGLTG